MPSSTFVCKRLDGIEFPHVIDVNGEARPLSKSYYKSLLEIRKNLSNEDLLILERIENLGLFDGYFNYYNRWQKLCDYINEINAGQDEVKDLAPDFSLIQWR